MCLNDYNSFNQNNKNVFKNSTSSMLIHNYKKQRGKYFNFIKDLSKKLNFAEKTLELSCLLLDSLMFIISSEHLKENYHFDLLIIACMILAGI
jgi:hypothetical protein